MSCLSHYPWVMAGNGKIISLRRFGFAHGQAGVGSKYSPHVANDMAIGLLYIEGRHCVLGNSDAAIACLVTSFCSRFPPISSENRHHLQHYIISGCWLSNLDV